MVERFWKFFGGKDGIDELKVHGLDDRDVCFILILMFICGKQYCGNLFYPDLIAKQKYITSFIVFHPDLVPKKVPRNTVLVHNSFFAPIIQSWLKTHTSLHVFPWVYLYFGIWEEYLAR